MGNKKRLKKAKQRQRRKAKREAAMPHLMVNTTMGNTLLSPKSKVFVRLGKDDYHEKKATELKEEQVLRDKRDGLQD